MVLSDTVLGQNSTKSGTVNFCLLIVKTSNMASITNKMENIKTDTFRPHKANPMRPPSSSPAGMLLIALIRSPDQAQRTNGFIANGVPSFNASPKISLAVCPTKKFRCNN